MIETQSSTFFVEVKSSKAQSGQFVLKPDKENKVFLFSKSNKTKNNKYVTEIISHMNSNFSDYENPRTKGKVLNMDSNIFYDWIKDYYSSKEVQYIMTKNINNYIFVPLDKLDIYFDVTATFRIKRSGSSKPSRNVYNNLISFIQDKYPNSIIEEDKKNLYFKIDNDLLHGTKFVIENNKYQFSKTTDSYVYAVRKLSKTANPNVIFSLN